MNKKISALLIAMLIMNLLDGDFATISVLDAIKIGLYLICFALLVFKKEK